MSEAREAHSLTAETSDKEPSVELGTISSSSRFGLSSDSLDAIDEDGEDLTTTTVPAVTSNGSTADLSDKPRSPSALTPSSSSHKVFGHVRSASDTGFVAERHEPDEPRVQYNSKAGVNVVGLDIPDVDKKKKRKFSIRKRPKDSVEASEADETWANTSASSETYAVTSVQLAQRKPRLRVPGKSTFLGVVFRSIDEFVLTK